MSSSPLVRIIVAMFWTFDGPFQVGVQQTATQFPPDTSSFETVHLIAKRSDSNSSNQKDLLVELVPTRSVFVFV